MQKKLTITVDEDVDEGLYRKVGLRRIGIEDLVRPHVDEGLSAAYAQMAVNEKREQAAEEWSVALIEDVADETR